MTLRWMMIVSGALLAGAGSVSDIGEQGSGGGDGWVWALVDAHDWSGVRGGNSAGATTEDSNVRQSSDTSGAVRRLDDFAHGGFAARG